MMNRWTVSVIGALALMLGACAGTQGPSSDDYVGGLANIAPATKVASPVVAGSVNMDYPGYDNPASKFKKGDEQTVKTLPPEAFKALTCTPGAHVGYKRDTAYILDFAMVRESTLVKETLSSKKDIGTAAFSVFHSEADRMVGDAEVVVHMNVDVSLFPSREVFILSGDHICVGMARIESEGRGFSKVTFPIRGGFERGQAAVGYARGPLLALEHPFAACAEIRGTKTKFNPKILDKKYQGMDNVQCPKGRQGYGTQMAWQLKHSWGGGLYVFVQAVTSAPAVVILKEK
jgi:hypothetical protein